VALYDPIILPHILLFWAYMDRLVESTDDSMKAIAYAAYWKL